MPVTFQKGIREYHGELSDVFCHCMDGATYVHGVLVWPHAEQIVKYKIDGETPKCIDCYNCSETDGCLTCRLSKKPCSEIEICQLLGVKADPKNYRKE